MAPEAGGGPREVKARAGVWPSEVPESCPAGRLAASLAGVLASKARHVPGSLGKETLREPLELAFTARLLVGHREAGAVDKAGPVRLGERGGFEEADEHVAA